MLHFLTRESPTIRLAGLSAEENAAMTDPQHTRQLTQIRLRAAIPKLRFICHQGSDVRHRSI